MNGDDGASLRLHIVSSAQPYSSCRPVGRVEERATAAAGPHVRPDGSYHSEGYRLIGEYPRPGASGQSAFQMAVGS